MGSYLTGVYEHAEVLAGAATSNVRGFYNAACYKWRRPAEATEPEVKAGQPLNGRERRAGRRVNA